MNILYTLNNIHFDYDLDLCLSDINLKIEKEKITAIVGPNGSGKTTLLNILAFLLLPSAGKLEYNNIVVNKMNLARFKKTVSYVQQNPYLLRGSVYQNIELGLKLRHIDKTIRKKIVNEVMSLLMINPLSERIACRLSGGEAQKVAIGRALALKPEVLILDEPFTYLDKKSVYELERLIMTLKKEYNKTIILTTHNQIQAQYLADHIYSVIKGRLFESELINLFDGYYDREKHCFNIGKQSIFLSDDIIAAKHIAIDPRQIVLSRQKLNSSMQNSILGKIISITEQNNQLTILINAGEDFHAIITHKAMKELMLSIGSDVWMGFKSSSILAF